MYMPIEQGAVIRVIRLVEAIKMDSELRVTSDILKFSRDDFDRISKNVTHVVILQFAKARELNTIMVGLSSPVTASVLMILSNSSLPVITFAPRATLAG